MPFYSYKCKTCGELFEDIWQSINDEPLNKCPECGGLIVRQISSCNFILKGQNWPGKDIKEKK